MKPDHTVSRVINIIPYPNHTSQVAPRKVLEVVEEPVQMMIQKQSCHVAEAYLGFVILVITAHNNVHHISKCLALLDG